MYLPQPVLICINRLQQNGFCAYAVGGCVRDALLGLTPHDYDLCTNATPEQLQAVFSDYPLVLNGIKHGTVGVLIDHQCYEITTFRTEGGYTDSRHPDWVRFVRNVEEDLARRDFTVNAMAYNPTQGYIDPWGGQQDLHNKVLRTVGDPKQRFTEDALRILRGVRFSVRFGLTPHPETEQAMKDLCPTMDSLARERVFSELCKLILDIDAAQLLRFAPVITQVVPELAPCVGFEQRNRHHIHDVFTHTAYVVERAPKELTVRIAALLHDIGKPPCFTLGEDGQGHFYGHASVSAEMADRALLRLKSPTDLRQQVVQLIKLHMNPLQADKKILTRQLSKHGWDTMEKLLSLQKADFGAQVPDYSQVQQLFRVIREENACLTVRDLKVNGNDLIALGIPAGKQLGQLLNKLLVLVQEEQLKNEKDILLNYIRKEVSL